VASEPGVGSVFSVTLPVPYVPARPEISRPGRDHEESAFERLGLMDARIEQAKRRNVT
jgi:hypothetical protein